jgi:tetratricopeptide (TPR) repeat protein
MGDAEDKKARQPGAKADGVCPHCGARAGKPRKRWYERTSVTLCVAAGLAVIGLGFVHIVIGVTSPFNLPFDVARRESFGYREWIVNAERIRLLPYAAAKRDHPLGVAVLQDRGYLPSGPQFEAQMMGRQREDVQQWQREFERTLGRTDAPWPDRLMAQDPPDGAGPEHPRSYNRRGVRLAREGRYPDAIAEFTRAIHRDPTLGDAFYNRALVYTAIGNLGPAASDFARVLAIRPDFEEGYFRRGRLRASMGEHDKAVADFTRVLELTPNDPEALFHRSLAHYAKGEREEAAADLARLGSLGLSIPAGFRSALEAGPDTPWPRRP